MNELTIASCFFNTPELLEPLLQSFFKHHKKNHPHFLFMDNSTDDKTSNILKNYSFDYVKNPGMTHHEAVNQIFDIVKTRYLLLVDSDIIFKSNIEKLFEKFKSSGSTIGGEIQGSRGGFDIKDRIVPWFCFIDLQTINEEGIRFFVPEKHDFHTEWNEPNRIALRQGKVNYDVGSEFYEAVTKKGHFAYSLNTNQCSNYYLHFEGMSWRKDDKNLHYVQMAKEVHRKYEAYCRAHSLSSVIIKGKLK